LAEPDYEEWSLEELLGVRTDRRGKRGGRPPKVVPMARVYAINQRLFQEDLFEMASKVSEIRAYLLRVALGEEPGDRERIAVCTWIYERLLGKQPVQLELSMAEPSPYEKAGVTRAIVIRSAIEVESKEIEPDPFDPDYEPDPFLSDDDRQRQRLGPSEHHSPHDAELPKPASMNPVDDKGRIRRENNVWE
jgi:hypothetical protein